MKFKESTKRINFVLLLSACIIIAAFLIIPKNFNVPKYTSQPVVEIEYEYKKVVKVFDGDTIEIEGGEKVRYIGVDTPEVYPVSECFGREAKKENENMVVGRIVKMEKDVSERDKYGRLLRYVYIGDTFVNSELAKKGFARATDYPPDSKYKSALDDAENIAKKDKIGLWLNCTNSLQ